MLPKRNNSSMLELARSTCEDADEDYDPTGEFFPDEPDEEFGKANQEYNGEYRFTSKNPQWVKDMYENISEDSPDAEAIKLAYDSWRKMGAYSSGIDMESGEPYRGEEVEAKVYESISEMVSQRTPVEHIMSVGDLRAGGIPSMPSLDGEARWLGIIDFDFLTGLEHDPSGYVDEGEELEIEF